jgi:2-iminobutanoate/2-iminopropanoate deaminase
MHDARGICEVIAVYKRYFPKDYPAWMFCVVPTWPGPFDIEMDCTAIRGEK